MKRKVLTMRKIIAVLLTVLMLASVLAAFPASAAEATTYDGTTATTAGLNKIFISEIGSQMYYHMGGEGTSAEGEHLNSMNFVELFNNSADDVQLDSISLLQAVQIPRAPTNASDPYLQTRKVGMTERELWREWRDNYRFISKMDLKSGKIIEDADALKYNVFVDSDTGTSALDDRIFNMLTNDGIDMTFSSGDNVAVWFITKETVDWMQKMDNDTANFNPRKQFVTSYYGTQAAENYQNYKIIMVWAWDDFTVEDSKIAADMFTFNNIPTDESKNFILGVAANTWDLNVDQAYVSPSTINDELYSMTVMGKSVPKYPGKAGADSSAVFAPANTAPFFANAFEKFMDPSNTNAGQHADYFAAGYVQSYRETGAINWTDANPTPGMMPDWQWAAVNPDHAKAPATLKTEGVKDAAKVQAALDAYVEACGYKEDGTNAGRDESNINTDYSDLGPTQEELKDRFNNKKKDTVEEDDKSPVVLIIIIVAAVLVVAGGACAVVFLVILPKKKKKAAVAVDAAAQDVPAAQEAAVAEDAPAEEEKTEE